MTPTEFGYWLRGTVDQFSADALASLVLQKAAEILDRVPAKAEPVGLTSLTVGGFCVHNVNVKEACPSCANFANPTWRVFGMRLPIDTRQVYIRAHDRTPGNPNAESGAEAAERATDA
jgi:hypothetical protein